MKIPQRLGKLLSEDQSLYGSVIETLANFEPWLNFSSTPFFPEYTDHGPNHIRSVLQTAESLITDESWVSLTPADSAVLIYSVLLHDIAMHLTEDGFLALIDSQSTWNNQANRSATNWFEEWQRFLQSAKRWDQKILNNIFGNTKPISEPPKTEDEYTKRDRLLIGEFLRRNHPNLANDIASLGVPTSKEINLTLTCSDSLLIELSGIIAKSHGFNLRDCFPLLKNFDLRQFKGAHPVYLMVVLRISDYIQVQSERAPKQALQVTNLNSPISKQEWKIHSVICDIRHTHDDPEAIFIHAHPSDAATFVKLRDLLAGLQKELDSSWAVLGEVYGRVKELANLGILIRRVRSNMDDLEKFSESVNYIPVDAKFRTRDSSLLSLLIDPLYDANPSIGIRELVQNGIDAVLERDHLTGAKSTTYLSEQPPVSVRLERTEEDHCFISVADQGIGMNIDVVLNYFLKAGASFRMSDTWRKSFEEEDGQSAVLRSGRFGIGALAAFILGNTIHVSTR